MLNIGFIFASWFNNSYDIRKELPSELRPFKEVMVDISAGKTDPMLIVEMSLSFRKTNFGFLVTILSWPIWAVAIIHDAIYSKKNKKED